MASKQRADRRIAEAIDAARNGRLRFALPKTVYDNFETRLLELAEQSGGHELLGQLAERFPLRASQQLKANAARRGKKVVRKILIRGVYEEERNRLGSAAAVADVVRATSNRLKNYGYTASASTIRRALK
jgi:hypothetical protein